MHMHMHIDECLYELDLDMIIIKVYNVYICAQYSKQRMSDVFFPAISENHMMFESLRMTLIPESRLNLPAELRQLVPSILAHLT